MLGFYDCDAFQPRSEHLAGRWHMNTTEPDDSITGGDAAPSPPPSGAKKSRITNRGLVIAILGVTILWLAFLVSTVVWGLATTSGPRTAVERSLGVYRAEVDKGTDDPQVWADYISALISGRQYSLAESTVEEALAVVTDKTSLILAQQTRLYFESGEYEASIEAADATIAASDDEFARTKEDYEQRGISATPERSAGHATALLLKARALSELGRAEESIEVFDLYLVDLPTAADVLVLRGDVKAESGDVEGAATDYRRALEFVPDLAEAQDGLAAIGEGN